LAALSARGHSRREGRTRQRVGLFGLRGKVNPSLIKRKNYIYYIVGIKNKHAADAQQWKKLLNNLLISLTKYQSLQEMLDAC